MKKVVSTLCVAAAVTMSNVEGANVLRKRVSATQPVPVPEQHVPVPEQEHQGALDEGALENMNDEGALDLVDPIAEEDDMVDANLDKLSAADLEKALRKKYDEEDKKHIEKIQEEKRKKKAAVKPYEKKPYVSEIQNKKNRVAEKRKQQYTDASGTVVIPRKPVGHSINSLITNRDLKYVFVAGAGGVGRTTNAAAIATQMSIENNKRVLLVSVGDSHSLGHLYANSAVDAETMSYTVQVGHHPATVKEFPNLDVMEVDPDHAFHQLKEEINEMAHRMGTPALSDEEMEKRVHDPLDANKGNPLHTLKMQLGDKPGMKLALALADIVKHVNRERYGSIVFDLPRHHTREGKPLDMLRLPAQLEIELKKLKHWHGSMWSAYNMLHGDGGFMGGLLGGGLMGGQDDEDIKEKKNIEKKSKRMLAVMKKDINRVGHIFSDSKHTRFVVVTEPKELSIRQTEEVFLGLNEAEVLADSVIVNKITDNSVGSVESTYIEEVKNWDAVHAQDFKEGHELVNLIKVPMMNTKTTPTNAETIYRFSKLLFKPDELVAREAQYEQSRSLGRVPVELKDEHAELTEEELKALDEEEEEGTDALSNLLKNMPGMDGMDQEEEVIDEVTGEKTKKKKKGGMNDWMSKLMGGGKDGSGSDFDINDMMKNIMGGGKGKGGKHADHLENMMSALGGGKNNKKQHSKYDDEVNAYGEEEDPYARFEENDANSDPTSYSNYAHHSNKKQRTRDTGRDYDIDEDSLQQLIGDDEELKKLYMDHYKTKQTPGQANALKGEM